MKEDVTGRITELVYTNESNYYAVLLFETEEEQFFAVGYIPSPRLGRDYRLTGEWKTHPKYGEQFAFSSFEELAPTGANAIYSYLASGLIRGVGPSTARAIVSKFGDDTLKVISESPEKLTAVSGIGPVKAEAIASAYKEQTEYADTVVALAGYDISANVAIKLYKQYGTGCLDIIRENPYRLVDEMYGIGFGKADKIAKNVGIPNDSPFRIKSAVIYRLEQLASAGDCYAPEADFTEQSAQLLDVLREQVSDAVNELAMDGQLFREKLDGQSILILFRYRRAENYCAAKIYELCNCTLTGIASNMNRLIAQTEKNSGKELSETQKNAVISAFKNGVSVITGGPGTGKTTIINTILAILKFEGIKTLLAAPTGRAAKRMSQAAGEDAMTIHRMLEYGASDDKDFLFFNRSEDNPLDAGCIIIDEASMVDILLMEALLRAIKPGTRLILVGDSDQLPPVGAGNVLADILSCEMIHSVRLSEIYRQAKESMIVVNAHAINNGEYPEFNSKDTDFFLLERGRENDVVETITELVSKRLPSYYKDIDPFRDIQILSPTRKGPCGTSELNKVLREVLNPASPDKKEKLIGDRLFREGDKVMQNKNNYTLEWKDINSLLSGEGVFNGDMGVVTEINNDTGSISVLFDNTRLAEYDYSDIDEIEAAFAMTVHKSQGSEFAVVVMPVVVFPPMLSTRNLLYTAVTRAKEGVVLVGNPKVVNAMVDNNFSAKRYSGLGERLKILWGLY